jgi:hypothetical protein
MIECSKFIAVHACPIRGLVLRTGPSVFSPKLTCSYVWVDSIAAEVPTPRQCAPSTRVRRRGTQHDGLV